MSVKSILRMGDPRLLQPAAPVTAFSTPELQALIQDMQDTMRAAGGVGLAAPQIGVGLQLVIFGFQMSARYPDAEAVPETILVNPLITPLSEETDEDWEGCLSVPGLRGMVPRYRHIRYQGVDERGASIDQSVQRLSCPGGSTRMRSPAGDSLPDAHPRFQAFWIHQRPVSRAWLKG